MKTISNLRYDFKNNKILLLMLVPAIIYFVIFMYLPMAGIVVAFKRLDYTLGIFKSPWIGFDNFRFLFMSGQAFNITKNTILYNLTFIIANTITQIIIAILMSEVGGKLFKKTTQTILMFPYFLSWVVVGTFIYNIFSYQFGFLNSILPSFGISPINFYNIPSAWPIIIVIFAVWKDVGYGSIIYLAAISGINMELYESADIDGANIINKIWHITLPSIKPTIIIIILLAMGRVLRGNFDMFFQIIGNNGVLFDKTDVIDTYVYRSLMQNQNFGMSSAAAMYQSVIGFFIIMITNYSIKRFDKEYALF